MRCGYTLSKAPNYTVFLDAVGDRKVILNSNDYASTKMRLNLETVNDTKYESISMFMYYKKNYITGNDGVAPSDVQVAYIQNFS